MDWWVRFPQLDNGFLFQFKRSIDEGYRAFSAGYGTAIEGFFHPLQVFLNAADAFFTTTPWAVIILIVASIAWLASRNWKMVVGAVAILFGFVRTICGSKQLPPWL